MEKGVESVHVEAISLTLKLKVKRDLERSWLVFSSFTFKRVANGSQVAWPRLAQLPLGQGQVKSRGDLPGPLIECAEPYILRSCKCGFDIHH